MFAPFFCTASAIHGPSKPEFFVLNLPSEWAPIRATVSLKFNPKVWLKKLTTSFTFCIFGPGNFSAVSSSCPLRLQSRLPTLKIENIMKIWLKSYELNGIPNTRSLKIYQNFYYQAYPFRLALVRQWDIGGVPCINRKLINSMVYTLFLSKLKLKILNLYWSRNSNSCLFSKL